MDPDPELDPHQLEKWDPDPHQNVLDPPHWIWGSGKRGECGKQAKRKERKGKEER